MSTKKIKTTKQNEDFNEKNIAVLCHLAGFAGFVFPFGNIIGPLIIWLLYKDKSSLVDYNGREALNFQLSITIYYFVAILLCIILIGFILLFVLMILEIVCMIIAAIKTNDGKPFRYPVTIRFI